MIYPLIDQLSVIYLYFLCIKFPSGMDRVILFFSYGLEKPQVAIIFQWSTLSQVSNPDSECRRVSFSEYLPCVIHICYPSDFIWPSQQNSMLWTVITSAYRKYRSLDRVAPTLTCMQLLATDPEHNGFKSLAY